jgi:hypothetical protein
VESLFKIESLKAFVNPGKTFRIGILVTLVTLSLNSDSCPLDSPDCLCLPQAPRFTIHGTGDRAFHGESASASEIISVISRDLNRPPRATCNASLLRLAN